MNKKYYVAPAIAVEHVDTESLCAAVSGGNGISNDGTTGSFSDPVQGGDAGQACGKIQINDVWE